MLSVTQTWWIIAILLSISFLLYVVRLRLTYFIYLAIVGLFTTIVLAMIYHQYFSYVIMGRTLYKGGVMVDSYPDLVLFRIGFDFVYTYFFYSYGIRSRPNSDGIVPVTTISEDLFRMPTPTFFIVSFYVVCFSLVFIYEYTKNRFRKKK